MNDSIDTHDSNSHEAFMKILKHPSILQEKILNFALVESKMIEESSRDALDIYKYVRSNWRGVAPPLASFALSFLFQQASPLQKRPKDKVKNY